jgi:hypothetical protein
MEYTKSCSHAADQYQYKYAIPGKRKIKIIINHYSIDLSKTLTYKNLMAWLFMDNKDLH